MTEKQWLASYKETINQLYTYVSRRTGGESDLAEDIVQETYLRALDVWIKGEVPENPLAWLKRVSRNLLISHLRKIRWVNSDRLDLQSAVETISLEKKEKTQLLFQIISSLKKKYADILEAFHFDGKSTKEIALNLAVSERAVEGRLRRARLSLKDKVLKGFK